MKKYVWCDTKRCERLDICVLYSLVDVKHLTVLCAKMKKKKNERSDKCIV